jgi:hypothetical protein
MHTFIWPLSVELSSGCSSNAVPRILRLCGLRSRIHTAAMRFSTMTRLELLLSSVASITSGAASRSPAMVERYITPTLAAISTTALHLGSEGGASAA